MLLNNTVCSQEQNVTLHQWLTLDVSWLLPEAAGRTYAPVLYPGKLRGRTERCVHGRLQDSVLLQRDSEALDELSLRLRNGNSMS